MPATKTPQTTGTLDDLGTASLAARRLLEESRSHGKPERGVTMDSIQEAMNRTIQETVAPLIGARFGVEAGTKIAQSLFSSGDGSGRSSPNSPGDEPKVNVTEIVKAGIEGRKADQEFIDKLMAARFEAELKAAEEARRGSERNDDYWKTLLTTIQQNHEKEMELVKAIYQAREEARQQGDPLTGQITGVLANVLTGLLQQKLTAESRDPLEEAMARADMWDRLRARFGGGNPGTSTKELRLLEMQHELSLKRLDLELQRWREEQQERRAEREDRAKQFENLSKTLVGALSVLPTLIQQRQAIVATPPSPTIGTDGTTEAAIPPYPPASASNATLEV